MSTGPTRTVASDKYHACASEVKTSPDATRELESTGPGEYVGPVIAGLITIAFVGMLQSLGAFAGTVPDATWRSDATTDDERGHAAGRGPANPDVIVARVAAIDPRDQPIGDVVVETVACRATIRFRCPEPRAPPALLTQRSS